MKTEVIPGACVIGWPINHSRSPLIHRYWLAEHGIAGRYDRVPVASTDLAAFLRAMPEAGLRGCNVTVPHKEAAFALVDHADETAKAVGAVNTIWLEDDRLIGSNTDVSGFLANLDQEAPGWEAGRALAIVIGAGGAGRGLAYALISRGFDKVAVVNRTYERAVEVADTLGGAVRAYPMADLARLMRSADILVNATSLGMAGQPPLDVDLSALPAGAIVSDIVYVPLETPLLAAARRRGLRRVDGLGMLLHQAAPGFARWFGVMPQVTPQLRAAIVADLGEAQR